MKREFEKDEHNTCDLSLSFDDENKNFKKLTDTLLILTILFGAYAFRFPPVGRNLNGYIVLIVVSVLSALFLALRAHHKERDQRLVQNYLDENPNCNYFSKDKVEIYKRRMFFRIVHRLHPILVAMCWLAVIDLFYNYGTEGISVYIISVPFVIITMGVLASELRQVGQAELKYIQKNLKFYHERPYTGRTVRYMDDGRKVRRKEYKIRDQKFEGKIAYYQFETKEERNAFFINAVLCNLSGVLALVSISILVISFFHEKGGYGPIPMEGYAASIFFSILFTVVFFKLAERTDTFFEKYGIEKYMGTRIFFASAPPQLGR